MKDWIPFEEGKFRVEKAYLFSPANAAITLENPYIEIFTGRTGKKSLTGGGLVRNILLVDLLEDFDEIDMLLDLGGDFRYHLTAPDIQAGKVFSPDIKSSLRFTPREPWQALTPEDFDARCSQFKMITL